MDMEAVVSLLSLDSKYRPGNLQWKMRPALQTITVAATSTTIWQQSPGRTSLLVALWIYNDNASDAHLSIGTGDFTVVLPQLLVLSGFDDIRWLPPTEFTADIVMQSDNAAVSPNEIEVMPYVFEVGA